jgi:3-dehydroquinate dehydratase II
LNPVVFILNGPNLNLLGVREPSVYGSATLADVEARTREVGESLGLAVDFRQSNHEGVLIDWIQEARGAARGLILNAGGFSHSSVAIADAVRAAGVRTVEVHVSNIHARERFRHHSYVSAVAEGVIVGLGVQGYELALRALARNIVREPAETIAV